MGRGELELGVVLVEGEVELRLVGPEMEGRRGRGSWLEGVPVLVVALLPRLLWA